MDRSDIFNLATQTTTVTKTPTIGEMFRDIITQAGEAAKNIVYEKGTAEVARLQRRQSEIGYPSAVPEPLPPKTATISLNDPMVLIIIGIIAIMILR